MNNKLFFNRFNFNRDIIVCLLIIIFPFLFYIHSFTPKNINEIKTLLLDINLNGSEWNLIDALWLISYRFLTLGIFSLWYLTCKHKWRYAILVPIIIESSKLISYLFDIDNRLNDYNFFFSLFLSLPLIILLTFLSDKLKFYSFSEMVNHQFDDEINCLMTEVSNFKKSKYNEFKLKLVELRKQKKLLDKRDYLSILIKLREEYLIVEKEEQI